MNEKLNNFMENIKNNIANIYEHKIEQILKVFETPEDFIKIYDKNIYNEINKLCEISGDNIEQFFKIYFNSKIDEICDYLEYKLDVVVRPNIYFNNGNILFTLYYNDKVFLKIDLKNRLLIDNLFLTRNSEIKFVKESINNLMSEKANIDIFIEENSFLYLSKEFGVFNALFKKKKCLDILINRKNIINSKIFILNEKLNKLRNLLSEDDKKYLKLKNILYSIGFSF